MVDFMKIYLVQHGKAKSEEEDPERPLSDAGKKETEAVALNLKKVIKPARIYHSPKFRAKQTAEIFSSSLGIFAEEYEGIKPLDNPGILKEEVESREDNLMFIGHLPHMEKLTSLLITGNPDAGVVKFTNSAVVCLEKEEHWRVIWIFPPELA